jgi:hypothetical protein
MAFLHQIMLLGLLGVSVPILIHLLNRYRYREVDWGAMELLRRAMVLRSRRVRIEDLILLALRCLAVALLAIAMARPTISAAGARFFGGESRVGAVIALDASYSMSHRPGVHSRFDLAVSRAREILQTLQPGDQVSVVLMGQRPRTLLRNVSFDRERIDEQLDKAAALPERLNLELCFEQIADLLAEVRAPVRECYVISDSQDLSWRQVSDRAAQSLGELAAAGRVYYLPVGSGAAENLALTDFQLTSGARRTGSMVRYVAEVRNFGRTPARNVGVTLTVGQKTADRRVVDAVPPGQMAAVPLYAKFEAAGDLRVSARLDRDALTTDDVRHAATRVHDRIRVLVVDGAPAGEAYDSETFYLMKALVPNPAKPSQASIHLKRIAQMELPLHKVGDYDIVVLANVSDLRTPQVKALHGFVRQGGGLIVFLGDRVNPGLLNARMRIGDESLLPAELKGELAAPARQQAGWPLEVIDASHPLGRFLSRLPRQFVDEARVRKLFGLQPHEGSRGVLKVAGLDAPLLVEKRLGRGCVLLFASSADRDWGSVAINPAYLIFLHESVTHLTRQSHERQFTVGEPLAIAMPPQVVGDQFELTAPDGERTPIQASEADGRRQADCGLPDAAGFYQLTCGEGAPPITVSVNVDPVESDVRPLTPEQLEAALVDLPVRILGGEGLLAAIKQGRSGREMWRVFMLVGLAVLALETFLAWHFSRRLAEGTSALPKSARQQVLGASEAA